MRGKQFDQIVRTFAVSGSRRRLLAGAGALLALGGQRRAGANQVPDSCASTGDVCTLLYGCCSGLTCATSSINPSYGVCIPGEGGMVSTGTALVLPFDEGDTSQTQTQTTTTTTTSSTTTTTDPQAERQARLETMRNRRRTNKDNQQTRRQTQQDRAQEKRDARDLRNGPDLSFDVVTSDPLPDGELVRVTNRDSVGVYITGLEPIRFTSVTKTLDGYVYISSGASHLFRSGLAVLETDPTGLTSWTSEEICIDESRDGFVFSGAFSSTGTVTQYTLMCDGTLRSSNRRRNNKKSQNDQRKRRKNKSRNKGNGNGKGR